MRFANRHRSAGRRPFGWLLLLCALLFPGTASADPVERVAVVVSQSVGVGALADHLGNLVADHLGKGSVQVVGPGEAARLLRQQGGKDPSICGSDSACLRQLGEALQARWVVALGVGSFGEIFSLELRSVDRQGEEAARSTSSTYAAPGPNWDEALGEALRKIVPKRLLHQKGELRITSRAQGAEVRLNGLPAGNVPLEKPLRLPAGEYQVEVGLEGFTSARETVRIEPGETLEVDLALAPLGATARVPLETYAWVASGTAATALVSAIGFHLGASSAMDDAADRKRAGRPFLDRRETALDRMTVSHVSYGIAGLAVAGAAVLFYLDHQARTPP